MNHPAGLRQLLLALITLSACRTDPSPTSRDGWVDVAGGDRVYYRLVGNGPDTLVFVPGGPGLSSRYLEDAFGDLGARHGVVFVDPRGWGRSTAAVQPDSLGLGQAATDLEALRQQLGLGPLQLVAHHWGAALAHEYGRQYPSGLSRLVLLAPLPVRAEQLFALAKLPNDNAALARHMAARAQGLDSLDPSQYCRRFWGFQFSPVEETDPFVIQHLATAICDVPPDRLRARERVSRALNRGLGAWNFSDSATATVPTLVIVGSREPLIVKSAAWWAHTAEARLLTQGRNPLFPWIEDRKGLGLAIETFLSHKLWPNGAITPPADSTP